MLMSHTDRVAKLHYMANGFRILTPGDHVVCGVSGARIALEDLRYWDVATQRAFASGAIASAEMAPR
ncbi:hypothetical protein ASE95_13960 [Sphingomonas sp. Leaf231]|uniref:DUF2093 domain-containing protein n=1 Tax=Sphingomonas sp. Leaf231 TaxID=1736301 RepID=UPI0006FA4362|nr:DUF2093 domain-containing protein [Sphingomonas sp. Leaf231]KQN90563.1 hypothetical protein ASE95_13960 [Sphingomonas sp. Leaf231]